MFAKQKNVPLLVQNGEYMCKMCSFDGTPPPLLVSTKVDTAFSPLFLHTASDQKLDGGKA